MERYSSPIIKAMPEESPGRKKKKGPEVSH